MHYVGYRHTLVATLPCRFPPKLMPQLQATRNEHRVDGSLLKLHSHLISVRPGSPGVVLQMPLRRCEHVGVSLGPIAAPNYNCSQSKRLWKKLSRVWIDFPSGSKDLVQSSGIAEELPAGARTLSSISQPTFIPSSIIPNIEEEKSLRDKPRLRSPQTTQARWGLVQHWRNGSPLLALQSCLLSQIDCQNTHNQKKT